MKNQQKCRYELKKARVVKNVIIIFVSVLIVATASTIFLAGTTNHGAQDKKENELEEFILSKLTTNDVCPGYSPVLIYGRMKDGVSTYVAGSGTLISKHGRQQVVTSGHIFNIQIAGETNQFAIRRLRPLDKHHLDLVVEGILPDQDNLPGFRQDWNDAVICSVGSSISNITCFYDERRKKAESQMTFTMINRTNAPILRSLVSGEEVPVVTLGKVLPGGMKAYGILYKSREGESGTGFVDSSGGLYVLKGIMDDIVGNISAEELGIPADSQLAIVLGRLQIN